MCTLFTWYLNALLAYSFTIDALSTLAKMKKALGSFGSDQVLVPIVIWSISYSSAIILIYYRQGQRGREHEVTDSWNIRHLKPSYAYHLVFHRSPCLYYYQNSFIYTLQIWLENKIHIKHQKNFLLFSLKWRKRRDLIFFFNYMTNYVRLFFSSTRNRIRGNRFNL